VYLVCCVLCKHSGKAKKVYRGYFHISLYPFLFTYILPPIYTVVRLERSVYLCVFAYSVCLRVWEWNVMRSFLRSPLGDTTFGVELARRKLAVFSLIQPLLTHA
jgi:hypothetical protein